MHTIAHQELTLPIPQNAAKALEFSFGTTSSSFDTLEDPQAAVPEQRFVPQSTVVLQTPSEHRHTCAENSRTWYRHAQGQVFNAGQ